MCKFNVNLLTPKLFNISVCGQKMLWQINYILHPNSLCIFRFTNTSHLQKGLAAICFWLWYCAFGLSFFLNCRNCHILSVKLGLSLFTPIVQVLHITKGSTLFWSPWRVFFTSCRVYLKPPMISDPGQNL